MEMAISQHSFAAQASSSSSPLEFHRFPDLPTELREEIWELCLPHRIYEVDEPLYDNIWLESSSPINDQDPSPSITVCRLWKTGQINENPPVIARVCHESRSVALKSNMPIKARPETAHQYWDPALWMDRQRDSPHLYFTRDYDPVIWPPREDSFVKLAENALVCNNDASLMLEWFHVSRYYPDSEERHAENIDAFRTRSDWLVVMRLFVVHSNDGKAIADGKFGLLGDAPVQIVKVLDDDDENAKLRSYWNLAESCERGRTVTLGQDFTWETAKAMRQRLRDAALLRGIPDDVIALFNPGIMFRLCPQMCNHVPSA